MDEDVLATAIGRDEAEAFGGVEEFYDARMGSHGVVPCKCKRVPLGQDAQTT
jgi:hypothetical protein